ncbi:MAG: HAD family hydrolase [Halanaeroarchaeum sp.]
MSQSPGTDAERDRGEVRAVSFDLFGTLIDTATPGDPATAVADALKAREVSVPDDWNGRYTTPTASGAQLEERSLYDHVWAALGDGDVGPGTDVDRGTVVDAVDEAFDPAVTTREDAVSVVRRVVQNHRVGILSNASLPGLAAESLRRSALSRESFDAVVTSVACGWRKPHPRAFEAIATALGVSPRALVHVGDDPATDGGARAVGAEQILLTDVGLEDIPALLDRQS